jgi:transcriptional regulator with XRE-family HTH domain
MAKKFRDLIAAMPPERQERIRRGTEELIAEMPLHELRRARELSQEHLAREMNQSQSAISRLERRTDMYLSTMRRYVRALGGELEVIARFPEGSVRVDQFTALGEAEPEAAD